MWSICGIIHLKGNTQDFCFVSCDLQGWTEGREADSEGLEVVNLWIKKRKEKPRDDTGIRGGGGGEDGGRREEQVSEKWKDEGQRSCSGLL